MIHENTNGSSHTAKRVLFWARIPHEKTDEWVLVAGWDESTVPLKAWKAFNKAFWKWKSEGRLFPLDELEAYQIAAAEMIRTARKHARPMRASVSTYLVAAAYTNLLKFKERTVDPARATYRSICRRARVADDTNAASHGGEDKDDREWSDRQETALNVQAFVEALAGAHSADRVAAERLAAECVRTTLAKLDADAQAGLRAWLDADGVWVDAARLYNPHGSVQGYDYRFRAIWAPAFKEACIWRW